MPPTSSSSPSSAAEAPVVLIAAGNRLRGDDGAAFEVLERVRGRLPAGVAVREHEGEPIALLDAWEGARAVVLVDAVRSGAPPGTIHRVAAGADAGALPAALARGASTHALGAGEAIELARALGRLPRRVVVLGVEGGRFDLGAGLSAPVAAALPSLAELVLAEVRACAGAESAR